MPVAAAAVICSARQSSVAAPTPVEGLSTRACMSRLLLTCCPVWLLRRLLGVLLLCLLLLPASLSQGARAPVLPLEVATSCTAANRAAEPFMRVAPAALLAAGFVGVRPLLLLSDPVNRLPGLLADGEDLPDDAGGDKHARWWSAPQWGNRAAVMPADDLGGCMPVATA